MASLGYNELNMLTQFYDIYIAENKVKRSAARYVTSHFYGFVQVSHNFIICELYFEPNHRLDHDYDISTKWCRRM